LGPCAGGYPSTSTKESYVKEDVMYMSIGTILAIILVIALIAFLL
jgi:hypothetical protein